MNNKISLLKTVYANADNLLEQVRAQVAAGADPCERTEYCETPLRVASNNGRFDVVKYLFEVGADPSDLNWTPLFHAVAYGSAADVKNCIDDGADLQARDTWERTPVLLAVQSGDIEKVRILLDAGASLHDKGRCDKPTLEYAIHMDDARMLEFLIAQGLNIESFNQFGHTPLMEAAEHGALNCLQCLLQHGADVHRRDRAQFSQRTAIAQAANLDIADALVKAGDDLNDLEPELRAELLCLGKQEVLSSSKLQYLEQKHRVFGTANPQKCEIPFWYDMLRCKCSAWHARSQFDDEDFENDAPVWCYDRFGMSITAIGNGEFIEIAGEHEDHYDPDFCIYNEVFHHRGGGDVSIYQYPEDIFPPTDFHTATLVGQYIYIIGSLGYREQRDYGNTPVYRLDNKTFRMEKLETGGEAPGWIYKHRAQLLGESLIRIQAGEILEAGEEEEVHRYNAEDFDLDLETLQWSRHAHVPKSGKPACFPETFKQFAYNDSAVVAAQDGDGWRLFKIISVHRIDVSEGQSIRFESETLTATADDFIYVVAYSVSEVFDNIKTLNQAANSQRWAFDTLCKVGKTTSFPQTERFMGFADISREERAAFGAWKTAFEKGQGVIE